MPRLALVACLICCLLITGCASRHHELPSGDCAIPWLENHPVARYCAYTAAAVGVVAIILGIAMANDWFERHSPRDPNH